MELSADLFGPEHGDGVRTQVEVHRVGDLLGPVQREIDVRHLPGRMDTGIGAPGPGDLGRGAFDLRRRVFKRALDSGDARQPHPALVRAAMVFDQELVARHKTALPARGGLVNRARPSGAVSAR